jgi:hypothetical protein
MANLTEMIAKVKALIQSAIDTEQATMPWPYVSTTPQGNKVDRIGIGVYVDNDDKIDKINNVLDSLREFRESTGQSQPILVEVDGSEFVVTGGKRSDDPSNLSKRSKVLLSDHLIGNNATVAKEDRAKKLQLLFEMRESNKNLKAHTAPVRAKQEVDFDL